MAILFHDIIYNPKSSTNEEDSAILFETIFKQYFEKDNFVSKKIFQYIIETKLHQVFDSNDDDLKLFIDFDLHILNSDRKDYSLYAKQVFVYYTFNGNICLFKHL